MTEDAAGKKFKVTMDLNEFEAGRVEELEVSRMIFVSDDGNTRGAGMVGSISGRHLVQMMKAQMLAIREAMEDDSLTLILMLDVIESLAGRIAKDGEDEAAKELGDFVEDELSALYKRIKFRKLAEAMGAAKDEG